MNETRKLELSLARTFGKNIPFGSFLLLVVDQTDEARPSELYSILLSSEQVGLLVGGSAVDVESTQGD
jgi:hypothetical protein